MYQDAGLNLLQETSSKYHSVKYRAVIKTKKAQTIIYYLNKKNIKLIVPIEDWELLGAPIFFKNALNLTHETVSLPIYPNLSDEEVKRIIANILYILQ